MKEREYNCTNVRGKAKDRPEGLPEMQQGDSKTGFYKGGL
jgi:hypothetical protein